MSDEPKRPEWPRYWWFDGDVTASLGARIAAMPGGRLKVRPDEQGKLWLSIVPPEGFAQTREGELNQSHTCPPFLDCIDE